MFMTRSFIVVHNNKDDDTDTDNDNNDIYKSNWTECSTVKEVKAWSNGS